MELPNERFRRLWVEQAGTRRMSVRYCSCLERASSPQTLQSRALQKYYGTGMEGSQRRPRSLSPGGHYDRLSYTSTQVPLIVTAKICLRSANS